MLCVCGVCVVCVLCVCCCVSVVVECVCVCVCVWIRFDEVVVCSGALLVVLLGFLDLLVVYILCVRHSLSTHR